MSGEAPARWIARSWALLVASSALYFLGDNEADNDLWMHLFTGRLIRAAGGVPRADEFSYTAAGLPWTDHEWLAQVGLAAVFDAAGSPGLWLAKLAIGLATAALIWVAVARQSADPSARGTAMVLAIAAMARGYAVRPQVISYFAVALLLVALDCLGEARRRPHAAWLLAATAVGFALWANAHAAFVVAIGILVLFAAAPTRGAPLSPLLRAGLPIAAVAGACLTPYGPPLFAYIAGELRAPHPISEWQPIALTDPAHLPVLAMMAATALTLPWARLLRRAPWRAVLVAGLAVMTLRQQRHAPLFAIVAAAPLADQLEGALAALARRTRLRFSPASLALIGVAMVAIAAVQLGSFVHRAATARGGIVYAAAEYPVNAIRLLRERGVRGNLALPLDWGGYALWHVAPAVKVSLDGRFATLYPPAIVEDNFAFFAGNGARATALLDDYDTTLVLVPRGTPTAVLGRPEWRLLYRDDTAELFARDAQAAPLTGESPPGWLPFP